MTDISKSGSTLPPKENILEVICNDLYDVLEDGIGEHISFIMNEILEVRLRKVRSFEMTPMRDKQQVNCDISVDTRYLDEMCFQHDIVLDLVLESEVNIEDGYIRITNTYLQSADIGTPIELPTDDNIVVWE